MNNKRIAIICDWIIDWGGAEQVLDELLTIFPDADIFTSVYFPKDAKQLKGKKVRTSFIQKVPFLNKKHKLSLTLRPLAFESFDLSSYDIVISSSSAESKGVITKPECLHICYCHTPTRYFRSHYHEYINMMEFGILNPLARYFMPKIVEKLRIWDYVSSQRPDFFIANSINTQKRITKYYNRESKVIYPPVHTKDFIFSDKKKDFYLYVGRCIPYKKFDLIVESFNKNGKKLIIVTNTTNKLQKKLQSISEKNIHWATEINREETIKLFSEARAFLFPPEEDLGIVPIEAMASGTPVIAYNKGGARETVLDGKTGVFFEKQTTKSFNQAIDKFEKMTFDYNEIKKQASKFESKIFKTKLLDFIESKISL